MINPKNISVHNDSFQISTVCPRFVKQNETINEQAIRSLALKSFLLYSPRLSKISKDVYTKGDVEFKKTNDKIVDLISKYNPISFSLSVTSDPSIHYTARYSDDLTFFLETYLENDDYPEERSTLYQIFKDKKAVQSGAANIDFVLDKFNQFMARKDALGVKFSGHRIKSLPCIQKG